MTYIPKNRIITNLKTNPKEFVYKENGKEYNGYYYKTYQGKYYTGKNTIDIPNIEIIPISEYQENDLQTPQSKIAIIDAPSPYLNFNDGPYKEDLIIEYSKLKNINIAFNQPKNLPYSYIPTPTKQEIEFGEFIRYFCFKINDLSIMEISQETFNKITQETPDWNWELYQPFSIKWKLGKEVNDELIDFNKSSIDIASKKYNLPNFISYFNNKFFIL